MPSNREHRQECLCHDIAATIRHSILAGVLAVAAPLRAADRPCPGSPAADQKMTDGAAAFDRGDYEAAAKAWDAADHDYEAAGCPDGRARALVSRARADGALGQYRLAAAALEAADKLADARRDPAAAVAVRSGLGTLYTYRQQYDDAKLALDRAMELCAPPVNAGETKPATDPADPLARARAGVLNNFGNLYSAQVGQLRAGVKYSDAQAEDDSNAAAALEDRALAAYDEAARLAAAAGDDRLAAKATANAAVSASRDGRWAEAQRRNADAVAKLAALPDSREAMGLWLTAGRTDQSAAAADEAARPALVRRARASYDNAARLAQGLGDLRGESYAAGFLASLYESYGRTEDARALANRAVFLAQKAGAKDALYRWQWLAGRVLRRDPAAQDGAIAAYTRAVRTLTDVRGDTVLGFGNGDTRLTFRREVAPVYYQLADLLIRRSTNPARPAADRRQDLLDARNIIEQLKGGELAEYFKDPCENQLPQKEIAEVDARTAVVYPIPLEDRTEILVQFKGGEVVRVDPPAAVGADELERTANSFRQRLETRASTRYRRDGLKLYDWLVRPAEKLLAERQIDTLVFVPDGVLRTVPMAALFDGEQFLVEKYALAITPSLRLTESQPLRAGGVQLLVNALSVVSPNARGFDALPNVKTEAQNIGATFGPRRETTLLDAQFTNAAVSAQLTNRQGKDYSVVHIASHGQFRGDRDDTFLLTYDGRLTLQKLEELIKPKRYGGDTSPVDLLTLSACQTAAGDDRAALGLAGVAIKAGARSAVASLWYTNDSSSVELITEFYRQLAAGNTTKAKALRAAQLKLLRDPDLSHPLYWAPYLVIGNWQ